MRRLSPELRSGTLPRFVVEAMRGGVLRSPATSLRQSSQPSLGASTGRGFLRGSRR